MSNANDHSKSFFTPAEVSSFRNDTVGCANVNHLNNAGAGLMPDVVTKAIQDHIQLESTIGGYEASALRQHEIQDFYVQAGLLLSCSPVNIAFTSSATDSFSRALSSIPFVAGDVILTDNDDFISNQIQFLALQKRIDIRIVRIKNAIIGGVNLSDLKQKLHELKPRLLAITHIPTNSGLVQPVQDIGEIYAEYIRDHQFDTWYILDGCQSAGQLKLDVQELHCDFLSVTVRKWLRGPRGTGFLYVSDKVLQYGLEPLFIDMRGADWIEKDVYRQKETAIRFEDWEFAYALVLGSQAAIKYCLSIGEENIRKQVAYLSTYMREQLSKINKVKVLDKGPVVGGLVTFHVDGGEPTHIVKSLLQRKINVVPSYRGFAVIDFDEKQVQWAIRASPHYYNTIEEIDMMVAAVKEIV